MNEYQKLMPYLGDYYQVTPGWAEAVPLVEHAAAGSPGH